MNISLTLLQIVTSVPTPDSAPQEESLDFINLIFKGGYVMIPIILLSFLAVFLFIERLLYINQTGKLDPYFLTNIKQKLIAGDVKGAISYCEASNFTIAKMLKRGLYRLGSPISDIESAIENTASVEISKMEKNLGFLSAIAAIAPMLGFLGTVIGMISSFYNISVANDISIGIIAGGIYQKMVTSGAGLLVGIVAHLFSTYLNNKIDRTINEMEITTVEFLDILHRPQL